MADVFVSYKAEDRRRVKLLVDALEADGLSVWWDAQIAAGSAWRQTIQQQLEQAKCVLVVWSKRSIGADGGFVQDEAARAQKRRVYVPIRIDRVEPPIGFGETQAISLAGWTGDRADPRYQSVLGSVRSLLSGGPIRGTAHVSTPLVSRRLVVGGAAATVAAVAVGGWVAFRHGPAPSNRIAVLPFANLSGDPSQSYFSDGIAEEIRSSLTQVGMHVIGRTSSEAVKDLDTHTAAAKLGVANILTGSVRRSQSTIRIDAELLNGADGVERWAHSYDRQPGDAIKIQTDIAQNVAQALSVALGGLRQVAVATGGTADPAAQNLYFKAWHDPGDDEPARDRQLAWINAALALDPSYAQAIAFKAALISFKADFAPAGEETRRGFAAALGVVNRAIAIAPRMAFGYTVRSLIESDQLQNGLALADARRAAGLPGADGNVLFVYAGALCRIGQFAEAMRFNDQAISLDPLDPDYETGRADILFAMRRYAEAVVAARRSLQIDPQQSGIGGLISNALLLQGKFAEARSEGRNLDPSRRQLREALIAARSGQRAEALAGLKTYEGLTGGKGHWTYAAIYAQLGMKEQAFGELQKAWEERDDNLSNLRIDPFIDPLRGDPRLSALERDVGLA